MNIWNINIIWNRFLVILCLSFVFTGCSTQSTNSSPIKEVIPLKYEIVQTPYPDHIKEVVNALEKTGGSKSSQLNSDTYVVISLGQRPSAGYKVVLEKLEQTNGKIVITYTEKKPEGMAVSVISYPCLVLKFSGVNLPIEVQQNK